MTVDNLRLAMCYTTSPSWTHVSCKSSLYHIQLDLQTFRYKCIHPRIKFVNLCTWYHYYHACLTESPPASPEQALLHFTTSISPHIDLSPPFNSLRDILRACWSCFQLAMCPGKHILFDLPYSVLCVTATPSFLPFLHLNQINLTCFGLSNWTPCRQWHDS